MPQIELVIEHEVGLHARPAALFVELADSFPCEISIRNLTSGGPPANAKSILGILSVGVKQGDAILIEAEGDSAEDALAALAGLVTRNFQEPDDG